MSDNSSRHIMIIAGEASGDRHGANLIDSLKTKDPGIRFTGLGGPLMKKAGQEQLYDIKDLAVMGLTEVLKKIFFFRKVFNETLTLLKKEGPDVLVLIDYPGFNVRLAEAVRKEKTCPVRNRISNGVKVVYYISPQVWAWGKGRVKRIGQAIEKMLVAFPFEEDIYREKGIPVSFVGHPLLDESKNVPSKEDARSSFGFTPQDLVISILPGSRIQEIKLILPIMLKTTAHLKEKFKAHFLLPVAPAVNRELIDSYIKKFGVEVKLIEGESPKVISASDLVITASGTATLETAILDRPMVIVYKVPLLSYLVLRRLIKLPYIGMVNILLKEEAFPEFIQYKARAYDIFKACTQILEDRSCREKMVGNLRKLQSLLGSRGAGLRAAQEIWGVAYGVTTPYHCEER